MIGKQVWIEDDTKDSPYFAVVISDWETYGIYQYYGETWKAYYKKPVED